MEKCNGIGECLRQTDDKNEYEKWDKITCDYNCQPIKCPNYLLCNNIGPQWYLYCHDNRCCDCDIRFGKWNNKNNKGNLIFMDNLEECCICYENNRIGVSQPRCDHFICINCFKKCYYAKSLEYPPFPYPSDIEDEYDNDPDNEKWNVDELIIVWRQKCDLIEFQQDLECENIETLSKCPLCRN